MAFRISINLWLAGPQKRQRKDMQAPRVRRTQNPPEYKYLLPLAEG
jgi:hypothetical protein